MSKVSFPAESFDAVVSLYAIIHVPVEEHPGLFASVARWLRSGGLFLAIVGHTATTGVEEDWLGAPMWSHADGTTYTQWLINAGFSVTWTRFVPEDEGGHQLILAQVPQVV